MKEFNYTITDPDGVHARPAGILVREAGKYKSSITLEKDGKRGDAKRIFSVMGLNIKCGQTVNIKVEGADEETAAGEIEEFLKANCL